MKCKLLTEVEIAGASMERVTCNVHSRLLSCREPQRCRMPEVLLQHDQELEGVTVLALLQVLSRLETWQKLWPRQH